ncbi:MAG: tetratricopeptide repeat protein [Burkholderiales bacterium]
MSKPRVKTRDKRLAMREETSPQVAAAPSVSPSLFQRVPLQYSLGALAIIAAALVLYWPGLRYPLTFDDKLIAQYVLETDASSGLRLAHRWLSMVSFAWVQAALGPEIFWQRLVNVLLHGVTAALLFGFSQRLFAALLTPLEARWLAFFGATLFALHPVAIYAVEYLVQRSIVMATLFSVASLWCVFEGLKNNSTHWYWMAGVAYALAVGSKEHAVMVPAVALALAILMRGASLALAKRLALPLAITGIVILVTVLRTKQVIGSAYEPFAENVLGQLGSSTGIQRELAYPLSVLNQATLFFRYLLTWILPWPEWMSIDIRTPFPREFVVWPYGAGLAAWVAYAVAAAWLLTRGGRFGLLGFGMLCPWLLSLTEMGTVRAQEPYVLYRSYLWMVCLPIVLPALFYRLLPFWRAGIFVVMGIALIFSAQDRLQSFSTQLLTWDDAIRKNADPSLPLAERAYVSRGYLYIDAARLDDAQKDLETTLKMNPGWPDAWLGRATVHLRSGRLVQARADADRALELDPKYAGAYGKRCVILTRLVGPAHALPDCERAVELNPRDPEYWINAGAVYKVLGRLDEARNSFERALKIAPKHPSAHYNYGVLLLDAGRREEAVRRHIEIGCQAGIPDACDILRRSRREP